MLGHCSAAFTLDTYTHVTDSMQRRAADKISVFLNANVQINTNMQVNVNIVQPEGTMVTVDESV